MKVNRIVRIAVVLLLALSVSGAFAQNKASFTLNWVAHPAYSLSGSDPARVAYLKSAVAEWQKAWPNVKLETNVLSTNAAEAAAKMLEQAAQNRAPDVAQLDGYLMPRYVPYLSPMDDLMKAAGMDPKDFFPFATKVAAGKDGKLHGLQFTTDVRVLYYRKDLVSQPPKTWDELLAQGKALKAKGFDAFLFPAGRAEGAPNTSLYPMFWGQGGQLVDEAGNPAFGTGANREKMLSILKFYKELVDQGLTPGRVANYGNEADLNGEVAAGKVAMFIGGSWQVAQLKSIIGEKGLANWAVARIPQKAGAENATSAGGWAWGIFTKDPEKRKAAFDLISRLYVGDAGMAGWTTVAGYLPTRKSSYKHPAFGRNNYTDDFQAILESDGNVRPAAAVYPKISTELQVALSSVVSGSKTPEKALDDAFNAVK